MTDAYQDQCEGVGFYRGGPSWPNASKTTVPKWIAKYDDDYQLEWRKGYFDMAYTHYNMWRRMDKMRTWRDVVRQEVGNPFLSDEDCDHLLWNESPWPVGDGPSTRKVLRTAAKRQLPPEMRDIGMPGKHENARKCYRIYPADGWEDCIEFPLSHVTAEECELKDIKKDDVFVLHDVGPAFWEGIIKQVENGRDVCTALADAVFTDVPKNEHEIGDTRWGIECALAFHLDQPVAWDPLWLANVKETQAIELDLQRTTRLAAQDKEIARLRKAVAFARCTIKSGEKWSPTCDEILSLEPPEEKK